MDSDDGEEIYSRTPTSDPDSSEPLRQQQDHSWWKNPTVAHLYCLYVASTAVTIIVGFFGLGSWASTGSSLMLGLGLINMVELVRNIIIVWRFSSPKDDTVEQKLARDDKSSVYITSIMLGAGAMIIISAIVDFRLGHLIMMDVTYLLSLSGPACIFFWWLGYTKVHFSPLFDSSALMLDGMSSMLFAAFFFLLFVSTLLIRNNPGAWWLDPAVALVLGITTSAISIDVLYATGCTNISSHVNPKADRERRASIQKFEMTDLA